MTNEKCLQLKTKMKKPLPLSKFVFGSFCKLEFSSSKRHELSKSGKEGKKKQMWHMLTVPSYFLLTLIETMRTESVQISFMCVLQVNYITKKILFRSSFLSVFIDMHMHTTWGRVLESSQNITK